MSETSNQERTESASPKRRREARERGDIPRSRELSTAAVMIGGAMMVLSMGSGIAARAGDLMRDSLSFNAQALEDPSTMPARFAQTMIDGLLAVAPILGGLVLLAIAAPLLVGGWNFSVQAATPDFKRMNPAAGLGRMFSGHAVVELVKGLGKFSLVAIVAVAAGYSLRGELLGLGAEDGVQGISHGASLMLKVFVWLAAALLVIAAIDVPWQLWSYEKKLKMSRQELRDEYKQSEGRPEVKARIRQVQHEMSRRRMMDKVPQADVIVTNPTHYAVALKYDSGKSRAPRVVAKGVDEIALAIRELAGQHKITIVEAPPLARALYRNCDLDAEIPVNLYTAVASVLTYVYQLRDWRGGKPPQLATIGDVPGGEPDPAV